MHATDEAARTAFLKELGEALTTLSVSALQRRLGGFSSGGGGSSTAHEVNGHHHHHQHQPPPPPQQSRQAEAARDQAAESQQQPRPMLQEQPSEGIVAKEDEAAMVA